MLKKSILTNSINFKAQKLFIIKKSKNHFFNKVSIKNNRKE